MGLIALDTSTLLNAVGLSSQIGLNLRVALGLRVGLTVDEPLETPSASLIDIAIVPVGLKGFFL